MTVPRRILFRVLADALGGQARRLESLTPGRSRGARGAAAAAGSAGKRTARLNQARRLRAAADRLSDWAGDPACYQGPPVDARVCGLLVALAYGHTGERPDLARLLNLDLIGVDGDRVADAVAGIFRLPA